jgi:hypothetical protein
MRLRETAVSIVGFGERRSSDRKRAFVACAVKQGGIRMPGSAPSSPCCCHILGHCFDHYE